MIPLPGYDYDAGGFESSPMAGDRPMRRLKAFKAPPSASDSGPDPFTAADIDSLPTPPSESDLTSPEGPMTPRQLVSTAGQLPPTSEMAPPPPSALDQYAALKTPVPQKPSLWRQILGGAIGAGAGVANASGRLRRPIDPSQAIQNIEYPGYGLQMAQFQAQQSDLQRQVAVDQMRQKMAEQAATTQETQARAGLYQAQAAAAPTTQLINALSAGAIPESDAAQLSGPEEPQGPQVTVAGQKLRLPTLSQKLRMQKQAEQANWMDVPDALQKSLGLGKKAPFQMIDAALRTMEAQGQSAAANAIRLQIAKENEQMRRDIAAENVQARRDIAAVAGSDKADRALDRQIAQYGKPWQTMSTGVSSQLDKILDAEKMVAGGAMQQALGIPKVLTALVSGQGSGVRITQAELNMIAKARGITGDIEGWFNKIKGQGQLTDTQKEQLGQILGDVRQRILQKKQIADGAIDEMQAGTSRADILATDKKARKALSDYETNTGRTYKFTATGQGGHKIGSDDQKTWYDLQTGQRIK